ncbi:MAG TPA: 4Fe-4S dicluster domain-containing protein [Bacteroidales bacterium]|nr:4Fe-4S dicluster domain-containing protein [Bacteroidales bacterium]HPF04009.1 4Fe-4S dicluster domain-containing protein [Bacteroidales bacterium]HPJ58338.1 4Fe-4S dicluster domain-containing protein [Bacteroidales bacterium]HPR10856.1 4Fe-4S dicluster domain-containing protein [Bacteroidales bacterium]HRW84184.1 4Fe-4S dicluster domain-containing protein [Bacteroidales bacterium]
MTRYHELLKQDVRFEEGLKACMNCGVCTAICPAAEFYDYDPRKIVDLVQSGNDEGIEKLLRSETIWYCGECMSCKTRCPRGNTPAFVVMALRTLSQKLGFFTESEKGRQQFAIKRTVGENIFRYGYCVATYAVSPEMHREQGPVWEYIIENTKDIYERLGGNIDELGEGPLRKIPDDARDELRKIFDVTGGTDLFDSIEKHSKIKAKEMGLTIDDEGIDNEYFNEVFKANNNRHTH